MMRAMEAAVFGALAGGLHVGAFFAWSETETAGRIGGQSGAASVSVQAAPEQLAALAATWQTAPDHTALQAAMPVLEPVRQANEASVENPSAVVAPRRSNAIMQPAAEKGVEILQREPNRMDTPPPTLAALAPLQNPVTPTVPQPLALPEQPQQIAPPRPLFPQIPELNIEMSTPPPALAPEALRPKPRPVRQSPAPALASPELRTAGTSGQETAGTSNTARTDGVAREQGSAKKLERVWGAAIQAKVQRNARRAGAGKATVRLQIAVAPSGDVLDLRVAKSSGRPKVDRAALQAVKRARRFTEAPSGLTAARYTFQITLRFQ